MVGESFKHTQTKLMEELLTELIACMNQADHYKGVHTKVYELGVYSSDTITKFRQGKRGVSEEKARKLLQAYETELHLIKNRIKELEIK